MHYHGPVYVTFFPGLLVHSENYITFFPLLSYILKLGIGPFEFLEAILWWQQCYPTIITGFLLTVVTHSWAFGDSSCILEVRPFPYFCFCVPCEGISFTINRLQSGIKHRQGTLHALIVVVHCTITAIETKLHNRIYKVCPRNNQ